MSEETEYDLVNTIRRDMGLDTPPEESLRGHNFLPAETAHRTYSIGVALRNEAYGHQMADINTVYGMSLADMDNSSSLHGQYLFDLSGYNVDEEVDPTFKITFDVKVAIQKYREMKAEVVLLQERRKECKKMADNIVPMLREVVELNNKLIDYLISPVTSGHFMIYERALRTELMAKRIEYDIEIGELDKKISKLQEGINSITQFMKEGVREEVSEEEIHRLRDPNLCAICVTNKVTHIFNPCGHTVCLECIDPTLIRCHLCRRNITNKIKIFFS